MDSDQNQIDFLDKHLSLFLSLLGLEGKIDISFLDDSNTNSNSRILSVRLIGEQLGSLIGYHGRILESFSHWLKASFFKRFGPSDTRLFVDVNGYQSQRRDFLVMLAKKTADRVRFLRTQIVLSPMSSSDRYIIHEALSSDPSIITESLGDGFERRVVVKPVP
ncbi:hypothetical protein COT52_00230 [candidate division WWE3 bacterium CG08_land_8_20_14_0_20_43_13]|uniref:R3H domain-containing protein n=1 Tax=candidate division WWE3 bacterium CG08_land_8_20_14_0_20_43_13 TaxID=1975087 RepID=A0A2H0X891_UNCKA|nr:MAG: hypothetical protein COT52_00230 [candidate division WWE3 bacterium CG08_land_8_20_14_0_20_43_13]